MIFNSLVEKCQRYFPDIEVVFKDQSLLMKIIKKLLFFNSSFDNYITTINSTVYFPSQEFVSKNDKVSSIILLHEFVHIYDSNKLTKLFFSFLYLFPQILSLLFLPLFFIVGWKIALPLVLLPLTPLPAYFRGLFEKRAYICQIYVMHKLQADNLDKVAVFFAKEFKNSSYYFMWPFNSIQKDFEEAVTKIQNNERPFDSKIFDILDALTDHIIKSS